MDPFERLGVNRRGATIEKVREAWKRLSLEYHPDKNRDQPDEAHRKMVEINNAYDEACDTLKREAADREAAANATGKAQARPQEHTRPQGFTRPQGPPFCGYRREGPVRDPKAHQNERWFSRDKETAKYVGKAKQMVHDLLVQLRILEGNKQEIINNLYCMEKGPRIFRSILTLQDRYRTGYWRLYEKMEACIYDTQSSYKAQQVTLVEVCDVSGKLDVVLLQLNKDLNALWDHPKKFQEQLRANTSDPEAWAAWEDYRRLWDQIVQRLEQEAAKLDED